MANQALAGRGLMQSVEEWETRNKVLTATLNELIQTYLKVETFKGLDLGCQNGILTDKLATVPGFKWWGVDPAIEEPRLTSKGTELLPGWAHQLSFPDAHFDCIVFANVYEHVLPEQRVASIRETHRVLTKGGILVGQLPNPYFPIEAHSRLPFMGWLPERLQLLYWRLTPAPWKHDFYVVTIRDLKKKAESMGFETVLIRNFNYPLEVIPNSVRWAARLIMPAMRFMPWSWQFVFRKI